MLILITAAPGSFKTAMGATKAKEYAKEGRKVYHNINGLNGDNLFDLPKDDDWTTTEDGSVIIYDEAQMFDFLQYKGREKLSSDHRVKNLETHRHTGHDIILITQSPSFLHNHVLSLVGEHHHLHRAYGRAYADVFLWRYVSHTPNSSAAKNKAESHHKFKPSKSIFDEYKSTTIDTHKLKIPPIYFKLVGFLLLISCFIGWVVFGSDNTFLSAKKISENTQNAGKPVEVVGSQAASVTQSQNDLSFECRKAVNVEKPECVQWFNDLSKNNGSVTGDFQDKTYVTYDPNKPHDLQHIQQQVRYEVTAKPVFAGCMMKNGRYVAYTQQGTILNEVSQEDCKRLIQDADRPFNYFADNSPVNQNQFQQEQVFSNQQQQTYKHEVYANNQVEPHLQQNSQVNGANSL